MGVSINHKKDSVCSPNNVIIPRLLWQPQPYLYNSYPCKVLGIFSVFYSLVLLCTNGLDHTGVV